MNCRAWHQSPSAIGGGERDRTDDLLLAKQALSQLSYTPGPASPDRRAARARLARARRRQGIACNAPEPHPARVRRQSFGVSPGIAFAPGHCREAMPCRSLDQARSAWSVVGRGGFEPPTSRLSSARSNQLSYQPRCLHRQSSGFKARRKSRLPTSVRKGCADGRSWTPGCCPWRTM